MDLRLRYIDWLGKRESACVREQASVDVPRLLPPAELQSLWYAGEFPRLMGTTSGECVEIVHFGRWNPAAGPVFIEAELSFEGNPPVRGGIEVQPTPLQWNRGANESPDYNGTLLYVTTGGGIGGSHFQKGPPTHPSTTQEGQTVPEVRLDITRWEFTPPKPCSTGCSAPFATLSLEKTTALLEMAAQYRISRKAARFRQLAERFGPEEALYHALSETLGYRHNKLPFKLLAQRFPLSLIRRSPCPPEPFLFAGSGFLPSTDLGALGDDTRNYLRQIWKLWWPHRADFERLNLDHDDPANTLWTLHGLRPVNHPHRRVAALAEIVRNWPVIWTLSQECTIASVKHFFAHLRHPYWDFHYTLTSKASKNRMALVGEARALDMVANIFLPAIITTQPRKWEEYRRLPAPDSNQKVELAITRLWGHNAHFPKGFWKKAVHQQGLLQIFEDCCTAASFDCSRCPLPSMSAL